jgi:nucleotide-binding universal stress UspA family protein
MALTILLCTDGSELSLRALAAGLSVLAPADRVVVATVIEAEDPTLVTGTGFAGGVLSPEESWERQLERREAAQEVLERTAAALERPDAELVIRAGEPGPELCALAAELEASVVVLGTRGRGGVVRAVLGSVSDHVVRHAPCPVVTSVG